ncbi:MAG: S26 family signal peptidase [Pseudonocardiales bacterium]
MFPGAVVAPVGPIGRQLMIKRVTAVPGGLVPPAILVSNGDTVVPNGSMVVLGDSLENSIDSRVFGYVTAERITAKVVLRLR